MRRSSFVSKVRSDLEGISTAPGDIENLTGGVTIECENWKTFARCVDVLDVVLRASASQNYVRPIRREFVVYVKRCGLMPRTHIEFPKFSMLGIVYAYLGIHLRYLYFSSLLVEVDVCNSMWPYSSKLTGISRLTSSTHKLLNSPISYSITHL